MSEKQKEPPRNPWVERLKRDVGGIHTDPIRRLAQHITDQKAFRHPIQFGDEYGSLHFLPPSAWRKQHPHTVPRAIEHCEGGGKPFTKAVLGGGAVIYWLHPSALMRDVPLSHAHDALRRRGEALATALAGKLDMAPLEHSLYFPPAGFCETTQGEPYEMCAALIIATDAKNIDALCNKGNDIIIKAKRSQKVIEENRKTKDESPAEAVAPEASSDAPTRTRGMDALNKLTVPPEYIGDQLLDDAAYHLDDAPKVVERYKNGRFAIQSHHDKGSTKGRLFTNVALGLGPDADHALVLPMDEGYFMQEPSGPAPLQENIDDALLYNHDKITRMENALQEAFHRPFSVRHIHLLPNSHFMVIGTDADHSEELLGDIADVLQEKFHRAAKQESQWRDYCDERGAEHRPPRR